jgi:hypothetical protein
MNDYEIVIENTITNINRVLSQWESLNKQLFVDNIKSILNSELSSEIRRKFSLTRKLKLNNYLPICYIENFKVKNITIRIDDNYYPHKNIMSNLNKALLEFDFANYYEKHPVIELTKKDLCDISFEKIKNIKF